MEGSAHMIRWNNHKPVKTKDSVNVNSLFQNFISHGNWFGFRPLDFIFSKLEGFFSKF